MRASLASPAGVGIEACFGNRAVMVLVIVVVVVVILAGLGFMMFGATRPRRMAGTTARGREKADLWSPAEALMGHGYDNDPGNPEE